MNPPGSENSMVMLVGVLLLGMLLGAPMVRGAKAVALAVKHFLVVSLVLAAGFLIYLSLSGGPAPWE